MASLESLIRGFIDSLFLFFLSCNFTALKVDSFNFWGILADYLSKNFLAVEFVMDELTQLLSQAFPEFLLIILLEFMC